MYQDRYVEQFYEGNLIKIQNWTLAKFLGILAQSGFGKVAIKKQKDFLFFRHVTM